MNNNDPRALLRVPFCSLRLRKITDLADFGGPEKAGGGRLTPSRGTISLKNLTASTKEARKYSPLRD